MAKIVIPENLKGKDLIKFVVENKSALIAQKKSIIKETNNVIGVPDIIAPSKKEGANKAAGSTPDDPNAVLVKIVGNACWWCDDQWDVLIDNSAKKTIQQRKGLIPHLPDHTHKLNADIGDVQDIYLEDVSLRKLGLSQSGTTQCIVMESVVRKEYDPMIFRKYKEGKVNQHSIGLQYIKIELAVNDESYEKEMDFWNKYYPKVLNKDFVDKYGFFWVVSEIKLLEISGVLFGSNELTPTLEVEGESSSSKTAKDKASSEEPAASGFDLNVAILTTRFFN